MKHPNLVIIYQRRKSGKPALERILKLKYLISRLSYLRIYENISDVKIIGVILLELRIDSEVYAVCNR